MSHDCVQPPLSPNDVLLLQLGVNYRNLAIQVKLLTLCCRCWCQNSYRTINSIWFQVCEGIREIITCILYTSNYEYICQQVTYISGRTLYQGARHGTFLSRTVTCRGTLPTIVLSHEGLKVLIMLKVLDAIDQEASKFCQYTQLTFTISEDQS